MCNRVLLLQLLEQLQAMFALHGFSRDQTDTKNTPAILSRPTTKVGSSMIVASPEALFLPGSVVPSSLSSLLSLRESRALWPSDLRARLLSEATTPYAGSSSNNNNNHNSNNININNNSAFQLMMS